MTGSQTLIDSLPSAASANEPAWLGELRQRAATRLRDEGFPTSKTEDWQFTPLRTVTAERFSRPGADAAAAVAFANKNLGTDDTCRVVMVNGSPLLSEATETPPGLEISSLSQLLADDPNTLQTHLDTHFEAHHFAALNSALFEDGLLIRASRGSAMDRPVHVVHVAVPGEEATVAHPRILVVADPGSELCFIESFIAMPGAKHLTNAVTEIAAGSRSIVEHIRVSQGSDNSHQLATIAVHQQANSRYASRVATLGGALCRVDIHALLDGEGADCILDGTYHTAGPEHVDFRTVVDHARPRCTSNEDYRGLIDGRGHAVFDGTVIVRRDAQQTSAHQQNHNLLMSDDAGVNTKPHLEIDADDVSCSHGATVGALDPNQLFYLRTRGIGETEAAALITFGFVRTLLDRIPHQPTANRIANAILDRLPGGDAIRDMA